MHGCRPINLDTHTHTLCRRSREEQRGIITEQGEDFLGGASLARVSGRCEGTSALCTCKHARVDREREKQRDKRGGGGRRNTCTRNTLVKYLVMNGRALAREEHLTYAPLHDTGRARGYQKITSALCRATTVEGARALIRELAAARWSRALTYVTLAALGTLASSSPLSCVCVCASTCEWSSSLCHGVYMYIHKSVCIYIRQ